MRPAKAESSRRGTTLGVVVADAIEHSLGDGSASDDDVLATDVAWFEANRARLARKSTGEFVAIFGQRVVRSDRDFDALATRVFAHHGVRSILMPRVSTERETARVRSPRTRR